MRSALDGLNHAQIIDISVLIEVEVGEHVRGIVDQILEILYGGGLCESGSDCLKVEAEGDVLAEGRHSCGSGYCRGPGYGYRCAVAPLISRVRRNRDDAGGVTAGKHQRCGSEQRNQSFHDLYQLVRKMFCLRIWVWKWTTFSTCCYERSGA